MICRYWATVQKDELYTLNFVLSDDPGETTIIGLTRQECQAEINSIEKLGYKIESSLREALIFVT